MLTCTESIGGYRDKISRMNTSVGEYQVSVNVNKTVVVGPGCECDGTWARKSEYTLKLSRQESIQIISRGRKQREIDVGQRYLSTGKEHHIVIFTGTPPGDFSLAVHILNVSVVDIHAIRDG